MDDEGAKHKIPANIPASVKRGRNEGRKHGRGPDEPKSPDELGQQIPERLDEDFPPLPDEEILAYADRELLTLIDLIVITNGQVRPGKIGFFVVTEHEISLPPLMDFDLKTTAASDIKGWSETVEASRLRLPCAPHEFVRWAESWVGLVKAGYDLPAVFANAVAARKQANSTSDDHMPKLGSDEWRTQTAKAAAEARHRLTREKKRSLQELWATGKYSSRNICADEECAALGISFYTARRALRNTPDPRRT